MKTLVIHPTDPTTDFLSELYSDKDWTVIRDITKVSKSYIRKQIETHDRIIMMGHGTDRGLLCKYPQPRFLIDSKWVWLLRKKECVCIWCNSDVFVEEYGLKGFYTGMIISEFEEAFDYCINSDLVEISESNKLFTDSLIKSIDSPSMLESMKEHYHSDVNPIIVFNQERLYSTNQ